MQGASRLPAAAAGSARSVRVAARSANNSSSSSSSSSSGTASAAASPFAPARQPAPGPGAGGRGQGQGRGRSWQQQPDRGGSGVALDPVDKARRQMGYKNNWHRRQVDESTQVTWPGSLRMDPVIAIIGGGLSGLMCATELARLGIRSVVFDTGQHGVGGRLATRASGEPSLAKGVLHRPGTGLGGLRFDHAAQFFTVTDPAFQSYVDTWLAEGLVKVWDGPVGTLHAPSGQFRPMPGQQQQQPRGSGTRYVATGGMRSLAQSLAERLERGAGSGSGSGGRPWWSSGGRAGSASYRHRKVAAGCYRGEGQSQGLFDAVVIAHNGKCANRLVGPAGAPLVAQQLMRLRLNAVWALMVAFDGPVPAPFEGAFIQASGVLSWAGNNTAKLGLKHTPRDMQCWTLFSTNAFGQANKVPQEAIPREVSDKVTGEMLEAFRQALGVSAVDMPQPLFTRTQLWGAALPLNTPGVPCVLDPLSRVGICGDWLLGGSMQAAAVSGISLARQLAAARGKSGPELEPFKLGLRQEFVPLRANDIGEFPE